jgi:hypothetical protein
MPFADLLPYLGKIVTTTQFRGIANLLTHDADGPHAPRPEGPAVIVHGLSNDIPGLPNHFITLLESGGPISVARLGAHRAYIEILAGQCVLTAKSKKTGKVVDSYTSQGGQLIHVTSLLLRPGGVSVFPIASFPKDDDNIVSIESQGGLAILFTVRDPAQHSGMDHHSGGHAASHHQEGSVPAVVEKQAETMMAAPPPKGPIKIPPNCTTHGCSSGCPQHALFAGLPAPH